MAEESSSRSKASKLKRLKQQQSKPTCTNPAHDASIAASNNKKHCQNDTADVAVAAAAPVLKKRRKFKVASARDKDEALSMSSSASLDKSKVGIGNEESNVYGVTQGSNTLNNVIALKDAIRKYQNDSEHLVNILDRLQKLPIDVEILRKTLIAKTVHSAICKNDDVDVEVAAKSKILIRKWKAMAKESGVPVKNSVLEEISLSKTANTINKPVSSDSSKVTKSQIEKKSESVPKVLPKKRSFQDSVLRHMFLSGKPFNVKGIAKETSTTPEALNYLLLSLVDKNLVIKKEFGKKILYWANQNPKVREIKSLLQSTVEIQEAIDEFKKITSVHKQLINEVELLEKDPSNVQLDEQISQLNEDISTMNGRILTILAAKDKELQERKSASLNKNKADLKLLERKNCPKRKRIRINAMRSEWKNRKEKCVDFVDQLADAMDKKVSDITKLLDIETDESLGVKLPPKHNID